MKNSVQLLASHVGHSGRAISGEGKRNASARRALVGEPMKMEDGPMKMEMQQQ